MATETLVPTTLEPPRLRRFSIDEYHRMAEAGILAPEERVQLLQGAVYVMTPIGPKHRVVVIQLDDLLRRILPSDWHIAVQLSIQTDDSEPEPDLCIIRGSADQYLDHIPTGEDVGLIIEVADTTREFDRTKKGEIYAAAGIPEFWLVNIPDKTVEVYGDPQLADSDRPAEYRAKQTVSRTETIALTLDGKAAGELKVADFLP